MSSRGGGARLCSLSPLTSAFLHVTTCPGLSEEEEEEEAVPGAARLRFAHGEQDLGQGARHGRSWELAGAPRPQPRATQGCCSSAKLSTSPNPRSGKQQSRSGAGWRGHPRSVTPSSYRLLIFYYFLFPPARCCEHGTAPRGGN